MSARYATRDVLLEYLTTAGEPRKLTAILRYMERRHGVSVGATRSQLWRLCRAGTLEELEGDRYQVRASDDERTERPVGQKRGAR